MLQTTLRRRLLWLLLQSFVLSLAAVLILGAVGLRALHRDAERQRVDSARLMALAIDRELSDAAQELARLAADLDDPGHSPATRLRRYRFHSVFRTAVSLVGPERTVVASDPPNRPPPPPALLASPGGVTALYEAAGAGTPSIALVQPLRDAADELFLVAEMSVEGSVLSDRLRQMAGEETRHVALVDAAGTILAVSHPTYLLQQLSHEDEIARGLEGGQPVLWQAETSPMCPDEPQPLLTVMVPLQGPPWGLVLQEHQVSAYATSGWIRSGVLATGLALVGAGVLLAITLSRSIVAPLKTLSDQAYRMREGDLRTPILASGDREIRVLGETLEAMRERLDRTLERLAAFNESLEREVEVRTRRLAERDAERRVLVRRLLSAGEEERCRIARELHDETAQMLTAVQLSLDESPADLEKARRILLDTQREIHRVIHDLRPSLLDDLGMPPTKTWLLWARNCSI